MKYFSFLAKKAYGSQKKAYGCFSGSILVNGRILAVPVCLCCLAGAIPVCAGIWVLVCLEGLFKIPIWCVPWVASGVTQLCLINLSALFSLWYYWWSVTQYKTSTIRGLPCSAFPDVSLSLQWPRKGLPTRWFTIASLDLLAPLRTISETSGPPTEYLHCRFLLVKPEWWFKCRSTQGCLSSKSFAGPLRAVYHRSLCSSSPFLYVSSLLLCVCGSGKWLDGLGGGWNSFWPLWWSRLVTVRGSLLCLRRYLAVSADHPDLSSIYLAPMEKDGLPRHGRREVAGVWRWTWCRASQDSVGCVGSEMRLCEWENVGVLSKKVSYKSRGWNWLWRMIEWTLMGYLQGLQRNTLEGKNQLEASPQKQVNTIPAQRTGHRWQKCVVERKHFFSGRPLSPHLQSVPFGQFGSQEASRPPIGLEATASPKTYCISHPKAR